MNIAVITWRETTGRFPERTESSCAAAAKRTVCDRYTASGFLAFSDTQRVIALDVRTAGWVGRLVDVADDLVDFARRGDVLRAVGIWARCGRRYWPHARSRRRVDHRDRYRSYK